MSQSLLAQFGGVGLAFALEKEPQKTGGAPPQFLSTHPSDETRIADLHKLLPEAMKYYKGEP